MSEVSIVLHIQQFGSGATECTLDDMSTLIPLKSNEKKFLLPLLRLNSLPIVWMLCYFKCYGACRGCEAVESSRILFFSHTETREKQFLSLLRLIIYFIIWYFVYLTADWAVWRAICDTRWRHDAVKFSMHEPRTAIGWFNRFACKSVQCVHNFDWINRNTVKSFDCTSACTFQ